MYGNHGKNVVYGHEVQKLQKRDNKRDRNSNFACGYIEKVISVLHNKQIFF